MNAIREIEKINKEELARGIAGTSASWHQKYAASAWVYLGNLDHELSEGDVICVMSQFGEVEDIHLAREEDTGKSRGFAFVKYEDSRSCVLAVDNFVGVQLLRRPIKIDHVEKYRLPKKIMEAEEESGAPNLEAGHAYKDAELKNSFNIRKGQDLFAPVETHSDDESTGSFSGENQRKGKETRKKRKKSERRKDHKRRHKRSRHDESGDSDSSRRMKKHSKGKSMRRRRHGGNS